MTTTTSEARMRTPDDFWGEPISIYTRQQAIEDGVLVDVSDWAGSGPDGMLGGFTRARGAHAGTVGPDRR